MAKSSSRRRPGDSSPDFSHLADHDAADDAPWVPPPSDENIANDDPTPLAPTKPPREEPPSTSQKSAESPEPVHDEGPLVPTGDQSHIFFDTDDPLSDDPDSMSGETLAMSGREADLLPPSKHHSEVDEPSAPPEKSRERAAKSERQSDGHNKASTTKETEPASEIETPHNSQLTDVGLPVFDLLEDADPPAFPVSDNESADDEAAIPKRSENADQKQNDPAFPTPDHVTASGDEAPLLPGPADVTDVEQSDPSPPETEVDERSLPVAATIAAAATNPADASPSKKAPSPKQVRQASAAEDASTAKKERPRRRDSSRPRDQPPNPEPDDAERKQRLLLILLASYASAVTIAFLWMWLARNSARPHDLESLPDVAPLNENEFRYAPQSATMPRGHTLPLGGEQQLGYIKVEPLRVTRGPVAFAHYADATITKPATEPVLKLWLRLTNVSDDQLIAPLDSKLLFTRKYNDLGETELANQIVFQQSDGATAFMLEHPETSEWDLQGQQLGHRLKPGESIDTYIPTQPGQAADLSGELIWRVHLRKGYNPQTGHGVTTMIEVPFNTSDIRAES